jgi:hypothetical protein
MEQKTAYTGIIKDSSGALLNKNNDALKAYKKKKEANTKLENLMKVSEINSQKISNLESNFLEINKKDECKRIELNSIKQELYEIKVLLMKIKNKE